MGKSDSSLLEFKFHFYVVKLASVNSLLPFLSELMRCHRKR